MKSCPQNPKAQNFCLGTSSSSLYESATGLVRMRLDLVDKECAMHGVRSPIRLVMHGIKEPKSIVGKLKRIGAPLSIESIRKNLNDIAGVRITCEYIRDANDLKDKLLSDNVISLVLEKDYIKLPKPNGYRSLHLIVKVPIPMQDDTQVVKCEIQIRTTAMDSWAGLEHNLRYKKGFTYDDAINRDLKDCADKLYQSDVQMQDIAIRMELFH